MGHRILVTGGAGYLGSTLVPELLAAGHEVTVVDNFMYSQNSLAHVCANRNFRVVRGDIRIEPCHHRTRVRERSWGAHNDSMVQLCYEPARIEGISSIRIRSRIGHRDHFRWSDRRGASKGAL